MVNIRLFALPCNCQFGPGCAGMRAPRGAAGGMCTGWSRPPDRQNGGRLEGSPFAALELTLPAQAGCPQAGVFRLQDATLPRHRSSTARTGAIPYTTESDTRFLLPSPWVDLPSLVTPPAVDPLSPARERVRVRGLLGFRGHPAPASLYARSVSAWGTATHHRSGPPADCAKTTFRWHERPHI